MPRTKRYPDHLFGKIPSEFPVSKLVAAIKSVYGSAPQSWPLRAREDRQIFGFAQGLMDRGQLRILDKSAFRVYTRSEAKQRLLEARRLWDESNESRVYMDHLRKEDSSPESK